MTMWKVAMAILLAVVPVGPILAQDEDLSSRIVNDPGNPKVDGARASLRSDPKVQGGKALRIDVERKGAHPWDASVGGDVLKAVKAGDRLVLVFSARLEKGEKGATVATLPYAAVQLAAAPYSSIINDGAEIGPAWKTVQIAGKSDKDYPAGALKVTIQLATARQTVDFGPIVLLDMGQ